MSRCLLPRCWSAVALLLAACATTPLPPLFPPAHGWCVEQLEGMPWQGAIAQQAAQAAGGETERRSATHTLLVEAFACREAPPQSVTLASQSRLVVRAGSAALAPHPILLAAVRVVEPGTAETWRDTLRQQARSAAAGAPPCVPLPLVPGVTNVVQLRGTGGTALPAVLVTDAADGVRCVIATARPKEARELVLLGEPPPADGGALAFWLPPAEGRRDGLAWFVSLGPADKDPVSPSTTAAAAEASAAATTAAPEALFATELRSMVHTLANAVGERDRRPALHGLARRTGALRCADLSLVADETSLAAVAAELQRTATPAGDLPADADAARLAVECAAVHAILPRFDRDELPPPERAWLVRSFGAIGRDAAELRTLLAAAKTPADAEQAVIAGNRDRLMDIDPAVRVVACDWLCRLGTDLGTYDPLAAKDARRAALRALAEAEAKAAAAPEKPR